MDRALDELIRSRPPKPKIFRQEQEDGSWTTMYHCTDPPAARSILQGGLRAGPTPGLIGRACYVCLWPQEAMARSRKLDKTNAVMLQMEVDLGWTGEWPRKSRVTAEDLQEYDLGSGKVKGIDSWAIFEPWNKIRNIKLLFGDKEADRKPPQPPTPVLRSALEVSCRNVLERREAAKISRNRKMRGMTMIIRVSKAKKAQPRKTGGSLVIKRNQKQRRIR
mmetsp:Transcript_18930/g.47277  ORF Transcript_18930/g.47277 Transcript_18930/m.47277 type:complete len:220 (-) Transcript_18930:478-1137(-)